MAEPVTIFLAGGGTGGHLYPGIAVAEVLRDEMPHVRPLFLCTQREIDRVILGPTGFEYVTQPIVPPVTTIGGLLKFWRSWRETVDLVRRQLKERRPAAVVGLGGYASFVAVKLAAKHGLPTVILNPDVIPGKGNRSLLKVVRAVCCQFDATGKYVSGSDRPKIRVTGCPIRADIRAKPARQAAAVRLGLDPMLSTLVVTGASLGARTVNEAVLTMLKDVTLRGWQILHLAGREQAEAVRAGYRELARPARIIDFTPDMADVWAVSDLAISRSGASSCAELTACGVPSVLMPYPYHKDMHQRVNAEQLADAGAAVLIDDEKDRRRNADKLRPAVESLLYDADRRKTMGDAARKLGKPDAAAAVAQVVSELTAT
jgi:UDP-N-acetylglucosamine--N-acetylmuramyl-(pentapeptide) pyrophosphoryl-undecaprenol N-acetylglucosamine transferase